MQFFPVEEWKLLSGLNKRMSRSYNIMSKSYDKNSQFQYVEHIKFSKSHDQALMEKLWHEAGGVFDCVAKRNTHEIDRYGTPQALSNPLLSITMPGNGLDVVTMLKLSQLFKEYCNFSRHFSPPNLFFALKDEHVVILKRYYSGANPADVAAINNLKLAINQEVVSEEELEQYPFMTLARGVKTIDYRRINP